MVRENYASRTFLSRCGKPELSVLHYKRVSTTRSINHYNVSSTNKVSPIDSYYIAHRLGSVYTERDQDLEVDDVSESGDSPSLRVSLSCLGCICPCFTVVKLDMEILC